MICCQSFCHLSSAPHYLVIVHKTVCHLLMFIHSTRPYFTRKYLVFFVLQYSFPGNSSLSPSPVLSECDSSCRPELLYWTALWEGQWSHLDHTEYQLTDQHREMWVSFQTERCHFSYYFIKDWCCVCVCVCVTITPMESPRKPQKPTCVCVCVCVWLIYGDANVSNDWWVVMGITTYIYKKKENCKNVNMYLMYFICVCVYCIGI